MDIYDLAKFVKENIPTFEFIKIIEEEGIAFHYTPHWDKIQQYGKFLGAEINDSLDFTQNNLYSPPAKHNPGVVFAYENISDAQEEGYDLDIIEIRYKKAIKVYHIQENSLDWLTDDAICSSLGLSNAIQSKGRLATLLLLNTDIIEFFKK